jgi:stage II sporulation protein D
MDMPKWTKWFAVFLLLFVTLLPGHFAAAEGKMEAIDKAFVLGYEDKGSEWIFHLLVGGEQKTYRTHNKSYRPEVGEIIALKVKGDRIVDVRGQVEVESLQEKIMAKNTAAKRLDLELSGEVELADSYAVYQIENGTVSEKTLQDVYVGAENVSVYFDAAGKVDLVLLHGKTPTDRMRIGLMNSGFASLDHDKLDVKSATGMVLLDKKANHRLEIGPDQVATLTAFSTEQEGKGLRVVVNGSELYATANRLYLQPAAEEGLLTITTFKRAYGNPSYRGVFEITPSVVAGKLNLINELPLEQYLVQVVPSEMPASFGLEALKAQSVAARTYALSDYFSNRYAARGFHVDDSTLSQVYNNSAENALTTQAVMETRGMVMMQGGSLVDARYYSTSGGYGAAKHEVWSDAGSQQFPGTPIPYLQAKSYTYDPANPDELYQIDTQDEAALNAFYKNLSLQGYDSESYYFRWKVTFSAAELENTINKNLGARYAADPRFVLTLDGSGNWVSKPIPAGGAGRIHNLTVTKRGAGGNMMELVVEGSTGTYKIVKEYNIRFTVRPSNAYTSGADVLLYRAKGGSADYDTRYTLKNYTILPSAFASFDLKRDSEGALQSVTFYGGGNGHGVGMSQYGASMLGSKGWGYQQILNAYYEGAELVDVYAQ